MTFKTPREQERSHCWLTTAPKSGTVTAEILVSIPSVLATLDLCLRANTLETNKHRLEKYTRAE